MQPRKPRCFLTKFSRLAVCRFIACSFLAFFLLPCRVDADEPATSAATDWVFEATNHMGKWIWDTNTFDKQTIRLAKIFEVPAGVKVASAILLITVDNGYTLYIDGEEIGRGSDWRTVTEYDITKLLGPGRHVLGVEAFNDRLEGGLILGLHIDLGSQSAIDVTSDGSWMVGPGNERKWNGLTLNPATAHSAIIIGPMHAHPWERWPYGLAAVPPIHPQVVHFWQRGWFLLIVGCTAAAALLFSLWLLAQLSAQARSQKVMQIERVRIARDIHDDLGARLTQLLLLGEVAQREQAETAPARAQFTQICDHARELAHAMDEVVWAINARRDTVRDFVTQVCKYAQAFLASTSIRCRLDIEADMPDMEFGLQERRNLFLAVKEALNNAAKHSGGDELFLRIRRQEQRLVVEVEDNGRGFDTSQTGGERNGLGNMEQRLAEISGICAIVSQPGGGCMLYFAVPLPVRRRNWFRRASQNGSDANKIDISGAGS